MNTEMNCECEEDMNVYDDGCICEKNVNGEIIANKNCEAHNCCRLCSKSKKCEFNGMIWWCVDCENENRKIENLFCNSTESTKSNETIFKLRMDTTTETFWKMLEERIAKGEVCADCVKDIDECECEEEETWMCEECGRDDMKETDISRHLVEGGCVCNACDEETQNP